MSPRRRRSAERVTLSDVAVAAGCSLMSASRALSMGRPGARSFHNSATVSAIARFMRATMAARLSPHE